MHEKRNHSKTYYIVIGTYKVNKKCYFYWDFLMFIKNKNKSIKIGFSYTEGKFFISNEVKHDMYIF